MVVALKWTKATFQVEKTKTIKEIDRHHFGVSFKICLRNCCIALEFRTDTSIWLLARGHSFFALELHRCRRKLAFSTPLTHPSFIHFILYALCIVLMTKNSRLSSKQ